MSGCHVTRGAYTWKEDRDTRGTFFWIVDPAGYSICYVDEMYMVRLLLKHLNRGI